MFELAMQFLPQMYLLGKLGAKIPGFSFVFLPDIILLYLLLMA